jgi:aspartate/tyrosine/aromatic aminotransferase
MKDEELNKTIAKAINWKPFTLCFDMQGKPIEGWDKVPNFCSDLNLMNDVEKTLTDEQYKLFHNFLFNDSYADGEINIESRRNYISASARQRAEAFIRTLGECALEKESNNIELIAEIVSATVNRSSTAGTHTEIIAEVVFCKDKVKIVYEDQNKTLQSKLHTADWMLLNEFKKLLHRREIWFIDGYSGMFRTLAFVK